MKLFILNLFLLLSGNDKVEKSFVASDAKSVIESYSSKESICDEYSTKDVLIDIPVGPLPDILMDRLEMPIISYIPTPPINPPHVTNVNP